jgi:hypothetical protein
MVAEVTEASVAPASGWRNRIVGHADVSPADLAEPPQRPVGPGGPGSEVDVASV